MFDLQWVIRNYEYILGLIGEHAVLSYVPILAGLAVALPLGIACVRWRWLDPFVLVTSSAFFAIPSLALFVFMLPWTGLTRMTALLPLTIYVASMLVRNVTAGIRTTDDSVRQSATAMGYGTMRRLINVELPIAAPVVLGGMRVATVTNIGMASVVSIIGLASLGDLFVDGTQRFFLTPILIGIVLTVAMAAISDLVLVALQRTLTPWASGGASR